ncbi:DUF2145 domain-containing protein [Roseateles oligotrophus]|uniref:DUF2145 domain-containing protein n=1 Tax=Roseateles oligotrophus TaxID=1769250 RepID=A0ABT2YCK4_9BURK|nr:DUF2145 domain-containing protein [Roseateles oligotrophus]MCV2367764.1 DUF2145 domain-containing protein [Roseateles oligotrophus]
MKSASRLAACLPLLALAGPALAGRSCEDKPLSPLQIERGMNLAQATARQLDASGAQVLVLARAGQDLSKYGVQWSHLGFAYREQLDSKPVWRVLHKLNQCGSAKGDLYRQGLGEFFLDRPHRYAAAYVALKPELQAALLPVLRDNGRASALHEPRYSMVAYAWAQTYQQSNQWVLETLASAAAPELQGRAAAQGWLKAKGYRPSDLQLSTATRLGARVGMANVAFDDHPMARRLAGHIETITADSLFDWLPRAGLSQGLELVQQ